MTLKRWNVYLVAIFLVLVTVALVVVAQQTGGTQTAQQAQHLDSCTGINAAAAAGSQTTLTVPAPPSGQFIYIQEIDFEYCVGAATTATGPVNTTTTNLSAANTLKWVVSYPVTANSCYNSGGPFVYQTGLKASAPGTAVTIISPAGVANMTYSINACYWYAP